MNDPQGHPQSTEPTPPDDPPTPSPRIPPSFSPPESDEHLATAQRRFRFESRRAIDGGGNTMVELLDPASLVAEPTGGEVVLRSNGTEVGRIPVHRLAPIDPQAAVTMVLRSLAGQGAPEAAQMALRLQSGEFAILDTAEGDYAWLVYVADDAAPPAMFRLFRPDVIPSWPQDDDPRVFPGG